MAALLEIRDLQTSFFTSDGEVRAVNGVTFSIEAGKTMGLVGESGCGKSVTALSVIQLLTKGTGRIVGGEILYEGQNIAAFSEERMRSIRGNDISMIFQEPMTSLNPVFSVGEQIAEAVRIHQKLNRREARNRAIEMLRLVKIAEPEKRLNDYPHQMSGGMRQRVMIAMALSCNPKLLIADEPTTALDVTIQAQILELISELQEQLGMAVLMITHDLGVVAEQADYDPNGQNLINALRTPGWFSEPHFLGTDHVGRDILSRIIYGARISLVIAATVVVISGVIGIGLGAISGFFAGQTDFLIQKLVEVVWAFPPLLLAIAIMAFFGQSLLILIVALVVQRWIPYCRVAGGQALSLRTRDFVDAARSLGASNTRIITRHVLPNLIQAAMVIGTFAMATAIIAEANLSFLGLGVPPAIPTWGSMLADGRTYISTSWWLALFPGLCIFFTVLGINMLGDGMRDLFDPRLKRSGQGMG